MNIDKYIEQNKNNMQALGSWNNKTIFFLMPHPKNNKNIYPAKLISYDGKKFDYINSTEEFLETGKPFQRKIISSALKIIKDYDGSNFAGIYKNNLVWHVYIKQLKNCCVGIPIYILFDGNNFKYPENPKESAELRRVEMDGE